MVLSKDVKPMLHVVSLGSSADGETGLNANYVLFKRRTSETVPTYFGLSSEEQEQWHVGLLCIKSALIKASLPLGAEPKFVAVIGEHTEPSQALVTNFLVFTQSGQTCCISVVNKSSEFVLRRVMDHAPANLQVRDTLITCLRQYAASKGMGISR